MRYQVIGLIYSSIALYFEHIGNKLKTFFHLKKAILFAIHTNKYHKNYGRVSYLLYRKKFTTTEFIYDEAIFNVSNNIDSAMYLHRQYI